MPYPSLHVWNQRGWLRVRKIKEAGGMLAVVVTAEELSRLRELRDHRREYPHKTPPTSLTTPQIKISRERRSQN